MIKEVGCQGKQDHKPTSLVFDWWGQLDFQWSADSDQASGVLKWEQWVIYD